MFNLQKTVLSGDIKSLPYINLSTIKSSYPKDVEALLNWSSFSHEHRHRRHHHNRMMHQPKNIFSTNEMDSKVASSIFSSPGNVSNQVSIHEDTNQFKTHNSDQVGQSKQQLISKSIQSVVIF